MAQLGLRVAVGFGLQLSLQHHEGRNSRTLWPLEVAHTKWLIPLI
jgi:hypothetical protein